MNSLVTALPGLVPIFVSAGGVNALAGVLLYLKTGLLWSNDGYERGGDDHVDGKVMRETEL